MKKKKLDAEGILRTLAEIRRSIPEHYRPPAPASPKPKSDGRAPLLDGRMAAWTEEDFEYAAVADGLESLADEIHASVEHARKLAVEKALEIYYAAEELSHDPAHAELIPHVQKMREAYERDFGKPIPPKPR